MLSKSAYSKLSSKDKAKVKAMMGVKARRPRSSVSGRKIKGSGDYYTAGGEKRTPDALKGAGARFGRAVAGPLGGYIGGGIHKLFKGLTGYGDYKVRNNTLTGNMPPTFGSGGRRTILQHREYLGDILSTTSFTIQSFPINAGMPGTFPWASTVANQFEQYCLKGCVFQYRSTSATSLTSGTGTGMGSVIMSTSYDSVNPVFSSESQMLNHEFSTSCVPSKDMMHPIECARGETPVSCLYTRKTSPPANADLRLYDLGLFQIATVGQQHAGDVIGQLWVTYDIECLKPQLGQSGSSSIPAAVDHYRLPATIDGTAANMFGVTPPSANAGSNAGTSLYGGPISGGGVVSGITFPSSTNTIIYNICYYSYWSTTGAVTSGGPAPSGVQSSNVTGGGLYKNNTSNYVLMPSSASGENCVWFTCSFKVAPSLTTSYAQFTGFTFTGSTNTGGDLFITALPNLLITGTVPRRMFIEEMKESKEEKSEEKEDDDRAFEEFQQYLRFKSTMERTPRVKSSTEDQEDLFEVVEKKSSAAGPIRVASRK